MKEERKDIHIGKSCSSCATDIFEERGPLWKQKSITTILISGIIFSIGLYFELVEKNNLVAQILFLIVVLVSGHKIIKKGLLSVRRKKLDMNFLMSIAASGAFLIGHGEEGAAVIFLFYIAEFLEDYAAERARRSVASLLELAPDMTSVVRNGKEEKIHVSKVKIGEIIIVRPGDKIPLDGIIFKGASSINQAPITGESMPVSKSKGERVFAGTINEDGYLEIKVTKKSNETVLSKIVKIVEEAQKEKSKTEAFIDRFAKYYTPLVVIFSFLVMTVPTLFFGMEFNEWFYRALVLLVVSCPCALAISTPVSMVSGLTSAARNGVLIKGGNYLEEIKNADVVVFDKTGTLTEGKPEITDIIALNKHSKEEVLKIAASLEVRSKHPLAEAIVREAEKEKIKICNVKEFKSIAGKGLKGRINGKTYYIGNRAFFKEKSVKFPNTLLENLEKEGKTAVLIGLQNKIIGVIALMDKLRENSIETISRLKKKGIKTIMLTGDNKTVAKAIAKKIQIDSFYSELLPDEKVEIIKDLIKKHNHVIMVGDGVNDAPALAKAHVGISMGAIGSDIAIESSDIALMDDDISKINYLTDLSRKTMSVVKQNVFVSIAIKGSLAIMAFPGVVSLWMAVALGDVGLSLVVILNALRIGKR